jgi:hypothetical protein
MSEWTAETIRQHYDEVIRVRDAFYKDLFLAQKDQVALSLAAAKEQVALALAAQKEAITKSENSDNDRFKSVNELRQMAIDQQNTYMTKAVAELRFKAIEDSLKIISETLIRQQSQKTGLSQGWGYLVGAVGFIGMILALVSKYF